MKKVLFWVGVFLAASGVLAVFGGAVWEGLLFAVIGGVLIWFFRRKRTREAEPVEALAIGFRQEIDDDVTRICCEDWVVLDTETTGLNPNQDKIIEIAAQKYHGGQLVDTFASFVNPEREIPARITKLTGIRQKDVSGAPTFREIAPRLRDFIGELPVVAHNAKFDADFVAKACAMAGVGIQLNYIDTVRLAKWCLPPQQDYKLETLIAQFGLLDHSQDHRALSDVIATENLYMLCREKKSGYIDRHYGPQ